MNSASVSDCVKTEERGTGGASSADLPCLLRSAAFRLVFGMNRRPTKQVRAPRSSQWEIRLTDFSAQGESRPMGASLIHQSELGGVKRRSRE
jgi:hypothetical protein